MTQAFFAHLLTDQTLTSMDQSKGRMRSYLLTAMKHFISNWRRDERTVKRGGRLLRVEFDTSEIEAIALIDTRIARFDIACDRQSGYLYVADSPRIDDNLLARKRRARCIFTSRVTNHPGEVADQEHHVVPKLLEVP